MYLGSIPMSAIDQVFRVLDFSTWPSAHICNSGNFRMERALRSRFPDLPIFSNDLSLYSAVIGAAVSGETFDIEFVDRLAFIEARMSGLGFLPRAAAVLVAFEMSTYTSKNPWAERHFAHYVEHFDTFLEKAMAKLEAMVSAVPIQGFDMTGWLDHANAAMTARAPLIAFPMTGPSADGQFRFIEKNTVWPAPARTSWSHKTLDATVDQIDATGVPYCIITDRHLAGRQPVAELTRGRQRPLLTFARSEQSSVRHTPRQSATFEYVPVDPALLNKRTKVEVVPVKQAQVDFLRDIYLARNIVPGTSGDFFFLVYVDQMLLGSLIFSRDRMAAISDADNGFMFLVSDISVTRDGRISKLLAMLATSKVLLDYMSRALIYRFDRVTTAVFSANPVSMKYRGIYDLVKRTPNEDGKGYLLQYESLARPGTLIDVYREWLRKYASAAG